MAEASRSMPAKGNGETKSPGELERLLESARDSLTDDMVARLAGTLSESLDLLDRINRSGVDKAVPMLARLVENGDLERLVALARALGAAQDAVSDDIVARLSATLSESMDLLDQVNRSGVRKALPALQTLTENGDLERLVQWARLLGSAQDALSDDIVVRLASTLGGSLDLLDRINRSGIDEALPAISELVRNGDLDRVVHVARLLGSTEDALSEPIVARLAGLASEGLALADRLSRNQGLMRLLGMLERPETQDALLAMVDAFVDAAQELSHTARPSGGASTLWRTVKRPETQDSMQFMMLVGKHLRARTAPRS